MSWDEKELLTEIDDYYNNTSKEQFLKDLEETNSLSFVEDVEENK